MPIEEKVRVDRIFMTRLDSRWEEKELSKAKEQT